MIDLILLGSGGGMPMPNRHLSSLLVSYKGRKILIDCGEGTQVAMRKMNTGFKNIDIILITHFHGDHIYGLPGLLSTIGNSERVDPITIIGPEGLKSVINGLLVSTYLPYGLNLIENPKAKLDVILESKYFEVKEVKGISQSEIIINTLELEHSSPCLGYSIYFTRKPKFLVEKAIKNNVPIKIWKNLQNEEIVILDNKVYKPSMVLGQDRNGIKFSYITDTRPIEAIPEFIRGSNLFICEGTYGSIEDLEKALKNAHMTFQEAATLALEGNVKELLLTHFSTAMNNPAEHINEASNIYSNTIVGYDGLKKTLTY